MSFSFLLIFFLEPGIVFEGNIDYSHRFRWPVDIEAS